MKTIKLTIWDRLVIAGLIGAMTNVDVATIRKAAKVLDLVEISDGERATINMRVEEGMLMWDDDYEREIAFDGDILTFLRERVASHQGWQGSDARRVVRLLRMLDLALGDQT